jgi:Transposase and inactivated derivatives
MSYDTKFRQHAIAYWNAGHTKEETATVFKVGTSTLQKWKSQLNETGTLESKKRKETWRKIDPEKLKAYVEQHPDAYLKEIAQVFGCSDVAVLKAMKRLNITRKKNHSVP